MCLLSSSGSDSTVAITFTNKAAGEMKDRILEYLFALWKKQKERQEISVLFDELSRSTGLSHDSVSQEAGKVLLQILHNYSRFSISTIDSFIHDILRMFSHDLKLPENFDVETDTDFLTDIIVSELLASLEKGDDNNEQRKLTQFIVDLSLNRFEENDNWDISRELTKFARLLLSELGMANIPGIAKFQINDFENAMQGLKKLQNKIINDLRETGKQAFELIRQSSLGEEDFYYKGSGIFGFFKKVSHCTADTDLSCNSRVSQTIDEGKWTSGKSEIPEHLKTSLTELFEKIQNNPQKDYLKIIHHLHLQLGPMALLARMQQILQEYNMTNQVVPIAEFNRHISEVVRNEPVPFIYERLGQKYRNYLIDEFQDTSVSQWHNFLPLIENSLSQDNYVMIVGDVKQSIYRFRNGEMEQLMILPEIYDRPEIPHFHDIENTLKNTFSDKSESPEFTNTNYRSGQYIVEMNNMHFRYIRELFESESRNPYLVRAYTSHEQKFPPHASGKGEVVFYPVDAENYRESSLRQISSIIRKYTRKGDIAILTRGKASAKQIAMHLMQLNPPVPVISSESLELGFSPAVNFIIDILKFIHDRKNQIAIIGAFTYLQQYNPKVSEIFSKHHEWLNKILEINTSVLLEEQFLKLLKDAGFDTEILLKPDAPFNEMISRIIRIFGLSETPDAYILFFQNKLHEFLSQNTEGFTGFVKWWEDTGKNSCIVVPEGTDAVRILTVHKAKGLQFPVVIYPFADFRLKDTKQYVWAPAGLFPEEIIKATGLQNVSKLLVSLSLSNKLPESELKNYLDNEILKQELDSMNIHYVAMTRAKNSLHVLFRDNSTEDKKVSYSNMNKIISQFLSEHKDMFTVTDEEGLNDFHFGKPFVQAEKIQEQFVLQPELQRYIIREQTDFKTRSAFEFTSVAIETGKLFHEFVSQAEDLSRYQETFEKFAVKHRFSTEQKQTLQNMIKKLSEYDEIKEMFSENMNHLNETTIIEGNKTYRPDKIVYNDLKTFVIDFKTGQKMPKHREQIEKYCKLLSEMNFKNITAFLIYVTEDEVDIVKQ